MIDQRRNLVAGASIEIDTYGMPALLVSDGDVSAAIDLDEATIARLVQALGAVLRPGSTPLRVVR